MKLKLTFQDRENTPYELVVEESQLSTGQVKLINTLTGEVRTIGLDTLVNPTAKEKKDRVTTQVGGIH